MTNNELPLNPQLIECPRDAMQGWKTNIPTAVKIEYLRQLMKVGFHTIDCGSFVSAKAIPQMADTAEVLRAVAHESSSSRLLVIVANARGAEAAAQHNNVHYLGFPFSVSPGFQQRNANSSMEEAFERIKVIRQICTDSSKQLVVYLSMAFGNPYGDDYSVSLVLDWASRLHDAGISILSLADTVGLAQPNEVGNLTELLIRSLPSAQIGVHLHSAGEGWRPKLEAAYVAGCRRFDGALGGFGGCPMANDELVGNLDTWNIIQYLKEKNGKLPLNEAALAASRMLASEIFR